MRLIRYAGIPLTPRIASAIEVSMYGADHETESVAIGTLGAAEPVWDSTINALLTRMDQYSRRDLTGVIGALGCTHTRSELVIERLVSELGNRNDYVKRAAAQALGEIGPRAKSRSEAVLILLQSDRDVSKFTRDAARLALQRVQSDGKVAVATFCQ